MKKDPSMTVLMTVYNGGEYLKTAVGSVLNQTYRDFEFLVINDCSTDESLDIIKSFNDNRIVLHNNEKNLGQTKSLNIGLRLAKGKYVARMDADDMAFPMWLEKMVTLLSKNPEYVAVGAAAVTMNDKGKTGKLLKTPSSFAEVVFHTFFGSAINHVGALLNKEIILKNGGYNEEFKIVQDFELWSSLIRNKYRITNIPEVLIAVRVHTNSKGFIEEKNRGLEEVSETIYRNVNSMTNLKISYDDAVKMRMFYRFPEQINKKEFEDIQNLYFDVLNNLKDGLKLEPSHLKKMFKKQMLIPYCKRAIGEIENKKTKSALEIISSYNRLYGFHIVPFFLSIMSFIGFPKIKKLSHIYIRWTSKMMKVITIRG